MHCFEASQASQFRGAWAISIRFWARQGGVCHAFRVLFFFPSRLIGRAIADNGMVIYWRFFLAAVFLASALGNRRGRANEWPVR